MLRGVSLAPQQRFAKDTQELPTELVNSIIGVSARAVPDYGAAAATTSGPAALSTSGQQVYGGGAAAPASPSLLTRIFRCARRRYHTTVNGEVPVFDANGNLTTYQTGVNMFRFRSLSLFYFFRAQPWTALITYSILLYLLIVLFITAAYYLWGMYCGAGLNLVASIYFTVVSLAANGGYLGEDVDTMTDSTHMCYRGRTFIVMVCSYVNIVFVGLVAALVVGKAEYTGKLGHRVVFSDFCTLTSIPGRVGQYRLSFRMANVDNNIPLAHGQLRLFCVTAELLREYRLRQKQMHLLKNSAPMKSLTRTTHGSAQQLLPGGETTSSFRSTPQLTESMLEGRRASHQKHKAHPSKNARGPQGDATTPAVVAAALMPPRTLSGVEKDLQTTRAQQPRRRNLHSRTRNEQSATPGTASKASATKLANSGSGSRVRRGRGRSDPNDDEEEEEAGSSPPPSGTATRTSTPSSASAPASRSSSSSTSHASETRGLLKTQSGSSPATTTARAQAAAAAAVVAAPTAGSDVTNSSMTSKQNSDLYAASPVGGVAGSFAGPSTGRGAVSPASMTAPRGANRGGVQVRGEEDDHDMERVHLRVQEMRWTCAEETYLDHGDSGQLSLWYPATITHVIDERSPLFAFMQQPAVAASLKEGPATVFGSARSNDSSVHPPSLRNGADAARHRFQLVAVFDATEMEAGSTITAKHTYTTVNIVAHYKFSDRLVHMQADSGEVMLDFHYFNALLPVDLIELSTTDSEM